MTNPTDDDPIRALAEMAAKDPEVERLLESLCELKEAHGSEGLNSLLDMWEWMLGIQAEPGADERRAQLRVVEGGEG